MPCIVNSRGGKQNFKDEQCVWKRVAKDGKHYRILEHSTGYFYQEGFLPSDTAEGEHEVEQCEEDEQEDDVVGDDDQEAQQPPAKKQKGGKGAAQAPVPAVAPAKAPKARGKAKESPQRSSKRGRK